MARETIDIGTDGNDGTGTSIRESFRIVNNNFAELYAAVGQDGQLSFTNLADTPATLDSAANKIVSVNQLSNGLIFKTLTAGPGLTIVNTDAGITIGNTVTGTLDGDLTPTLSADLNANGYTIGGLADPTSGIVSAFNAEYNTSLDGRNFAATQGYVTNRAISRGVSYSIASVSASNPAVLNVDDTFGHAFNNLDRVKITNVPGLTAEYYYIKNTSTATGVQLYLDSEATVPVSGVGITVNSGSRISQFVAQPMVQPLILHGAPVLPNEAATKSFVEGLLAAADSLAELNDVSITNLGSDNLLAYNGTKWQNYAVSGDVTLSVAGGVLTTAISAGSIVNADVAAGAAIAQTKLALVDATANTTAAAAVKGITSFNSSEFVITNGWTSIRDNGVTLTKIATIGAKTVIGNSTTGVTTPSAVSMGTIVTEGDGIKNALFTSVGVMAVTARDGSSNTYGIVPVTDTVTNSAIVRRTADGFIELKNSTSAADGVTLPKIQRIATGKILGNFSGVAAAPTEVNPADILGAAGGVSSSSFTSTGALTVTVDGSTKVYASMPIDTTPVANALVRRDANKYIALENSTSTTTGITLNKIQQIATNSILGNISGNTAAITVLTPGIVVTEGDGIKNSLFTSVGVMAVAARAGGVNTYSNIAVSTTATSNSIVQRTPGGEIEASNIIASGAVTGANLSTSVEAVSSGAISTTVTATYFTITAAATSTLAAGVTGLIKTLVLDSNGGDIANTMTVTVTNGAWGNTLVFNTVGQGCTLQYINNKWFCVGNNGVTFS